MIEYDKLSVREANATLDEQQRIGFYEHRAQSTFEAGNRQAQEPSYDEQATEILWDEARAFGLVANRLNNMEVVSPEVISINGLQLLVCMKLDELTKSQELQEYTEKIGLLRRRHLSKRAFESTKEIGINDFQRVRIEAVREQKALTLGQTTPDRDYYDVTEWDGLDYNGLGKRSNNAPCITRWRVDSDTGSLLEVASSAHYVAEANTDVFRSAGIDQQPGNAQLERLYQVLSGSTV